MTAADEGKVSRLELLAEINRLDVMSRALKSHRLAQEERLRKIAALRSRLEERLRDLEGGAKAGDSSGT